MLANEIRNEITIEQLFRSVPSLRHEIIDDCKKFGNFSIICDDHIYEDSLFAIRPKWESCFTGWARNEGFNVNYIYNGYGVKHIKLSL